MKLFKKQFKPTVKFFIVFLAVAGVAYLLFKDTLKESFVNANYIFVGIKYEGSLSTLYTSFSSIDFIKNTLKIESATNEVIRLDILTKYPKEILGSIVDKYPEFKYSIIDTSTNNVIYDPVAEYKRNKTMSPFPNTNDVGKYILYSNYYKIIPIEELKKVKYIFFIPEDTKTVCLTIVDINYLSKAMKALPALDNWGKSIKVKDDGTKDEGDPTLKAKFDDIVKDTIIPNPIPSVPPLSIYSLFSSFNVTSYVYEDCTPSSSNLYDDSTKLIFDSMSKKLETVKKSEEVEKKPDADAGIQCCTIS